MLIPDSNYFRRDPDLKTITLENKFQKRLTDPFEWFMHHSAGNECKDWSHEAIEAAFSATGYNRGYAIRNVDGNIINHLPSYHKHAQILTDAPNYSQVQFTLHYHTGQGWCLVPIVKYTMSDVCWHCGDTKFYPKSNEMNNRSMAVEVCGNFEFKKLDLDALDYLGAILKGYHQYIVQSLAVPEDHKHDTGLTIFGHRDVANTVCPGMIYAQLNYLRERVYA